MPGHGHGLGHNRPSGLIFVKEKEHKQIIRLFIFIKQLTCMVKHPEEQQKLREMPETTPWTDLLLQDKDQQHCRAH